MTATDPASALTPPAQEHHRPWGWIITCVLLLVIAAGLAVWAVSLNGDLNDQKDKTAQAQQQADQAKSQVDSISGQIDDLTTTVTDAADQLSQAGADAQANAQQVLDQAKTKLTSLKGGVQDAIDKLKASQDDQ
jgi:chromosome segregation ATPase